jgi:hypothetical protein
MTLVVIAASAFIPYLVDLVFIIASACPATRVLQYL